MTDHWGIHRPSAQSSGAYESRTGEATGGLELGLEMTDRYGFRLRGWSESVGECRKSGAEWSALGGDGGDGWPISQLNWL